MKSQGIDDDFGATNLRMKCNDDNWLDSHLSDRRFSEVFDKGDLSAPLSCGRQKVICAIRVNMDPKGGPSYDDAAMLTAEFGCCGLPKGTGI